MTFDCEKKLMKHLIEDHGFEDGSDQDHPFRVERDGVGVCCFSAITARMSVEDILASVRQRATSTIITIN